MKKMMALMALAASSASALAAQPDEPDTRTRTYVYPTRIVWETERQSFDDGWPMRRETVQMEKLLEHKRGQVSEGYFGTSVGTKLVNRGEAPGVLLDFGRELHGGVQIGISKESSAMARLRLRFGESVGEAMSTLGDGRHACNDHSVRDLELEVPRFGTIEVGNTGFRFLRLDLVTGGEVGFEFVRAVSLMRPMKTIGTFRSSDERLNRIYETGVRTAHLCCQEHLWDGIKRDRLVWIGDDSYTAMKAVLPVFGAASVVPETLDHAIATTPPERWMVLPSYTLWFVRCLADWYRYTGDIAYLRGHAEYLRKTMDHVLAKGMQPDGRWTGGAFLDWHTHANRPASLDGLQAVSAMAYDDAAFLFAELGEAERASSWRALAATARKVPVQPHGAKLSAALQVQAGMLEAKTAIDGWLCKEPGIDQSPFSSYFIADVLSAAGRQDLALPTMRNYFGAMLDMGATSFWEGFDVAWTNGATRIDEMPVAGRKEVHGDFGEFCYPGFRNSLCHSWGAGVSAWCIQRILGIRPLDVGCRTVEVRPSLGDLSWAEGAMALPDGRAVRVRAARRADGTLDVKVDAPEGVKVVR